MDTTNFQKPDYTYRCTLDRVVDGDTIDVHLDLGLGMTALRRLRLMAVDTEELKSRDPERRERAHHTRAFVIEQLDWADELFIKTVKDKEGKYGRLLAYVWLRIGSEYVCLNDMLINEGHSKAP